MDSDRTPLTILVDADACPVKEEIYRVAARYKAQVVVVSNAPFRVPQSPLVRRVVVSDAFDAADDWIAEEAARAAPRCVVVTGDILLAERCLNAGARVLAHNDLRAGMDGIGGGPPPFAKADRSRFLQALDRVLVELARKNPGR